MDKVQAKGEAHRDFELSVSMQADDVRFYLE